MSIAKQELALAHREDRRGSRREDLEGRRELSADWSYRTKAGDPLPAADDDLETSWVVPRTLNGDEFFEITFKAPVIVSGLVMRLARTSAFPNHFKIAGRLPNGQWIPVAWFDDAHKLQLLDTLLETPRNASVGFDLGERELTGLMGMVEDDGSSFSGWSISEIEVWVPARPDGGRENRDAR